MNKEEDLQLLFTRLTSYLTNDNKKYDSTQMINSIISTIIQYFDCDYSKLADAIEVLNQMKQSDIHTKFADVYNKFDISGGTGLSVKGFLSKGQPMLFFYLGDDENPYAIVKTETNGKVDRYSVELSNSPEVLSTYKKSSFDVKNDAFVVVEDYEYYLDKCRSTRNVYSETVPASKNHLIDISEFSDIAPEHKNFFKLLVNSMSSNGVDLSKVSPFGTDILFLSFYDTIKLLSGESKELPLEDLIYLINETLYSDRISLSKGDSELLSNMESASAIDTHNMQKKIVFDRFVDGHMLTYNIVKSEKYFSVEVFENNKKRSGAMIVGTSDGFSFIRNIAPSESKEGKYVSSYVMNFSDRKIKFMTMSNDGLKSKNAGRTLEILLSFDKDGRIKLASTDASVAKIQPIKSNSPAIESMATPLSYI